MSEVFHFNAVIARVFERSLAKRAIKGPNYEHDKSDVVVERDPPQWYVQIGDVSFMTGPDKPDFNDGDPVIVTIRKRERA